MERQRASSPAVGMQSQQLLMKESEYQRWAASEGIPVHYDAGGFANIVELPRSPWARTGGSACFLETLGTRQADLGMYVADIPGRKATEMQHHLYPEVLVILKGRGSTQLSLREGGAALTFEWREGSVFYIPHNGWYRLFNGSEEPVVYLAITRAPGVFNVLYDPDVIFNSNAVFSSIYDTDSGESFYTRKVEHLLGTRKTSWWETNFIPDVLHFALEPDIRLQSGMRGGFWMGHRWPSGHIAQWGAGSYYKAHWHGPGAVLLGYLGSGYVLLWPRELGIHPYADGYEDYVTNIEWGKHSLYVPYDGAYHQHFNTSSTPALHLAVHGASERPVFKDFNGVEENVVLMTQREGGTLIDFEDEDPEIRKRFEEALRKNGVENRMAPVQYSRA